MIISNENILSLLLDAVPEFQMDRNVFFDDAEMIQLGMFEKFMMEQLTSAETNEELLQRGFGFLNRMAEHGTDAVLDILTTGVFIPIKSRGINYVGRVKKYLSKEALKLLDTVN